MSIDQEAWKKFLSGHWQKEMPQREGAFPQATRQGEVGATLHGIVYNDPLTGDWMAVHSWLGWWWSEPIPSLPKPPPWEVES